MIYLLLILIAGINTAPFIFPQLDIWHAQGIWVQACILVLFSATFFISPKFKERVNIELGILHLWVGLQTAYICFISQTKHKYDITHFFPYFNFLCLLILYKIIVQYLTIEDAKKTLWVLKYVLIGTILMSTLQYFGVSQFFKMLYPKDHFHNNPIVGFIGNGTHLSGFLAMMTPVFLYYGKREDYLCLFLIGILLTMTGTSSNDTAISGFLVVSFIFSVWMFHIKPIYSYIFISLLVSIGLILYIHNSLLFSFSGRIGIWNNYIPLIKNWFLTGAGLGTMNAIYKETLNPNVRHMHMEYFQFILEIGIIGVISALALIRKLWIYESIDRLSLTFKMIFLGFCVSALFNYPAHIWLVSTYAVIAYAFFMVLKRGDNRACIDAQAN